MNNEILQSNFTDFICGEKIGILVKEKMANSTITHIHNTNSQHLTKQQLHIDDSEFEKIILIRHPLEIYCSGYLEDLWNYFNWTFGVNWVEKLYTSYYFGNDSFKIPEDIEEVILDVHKVGGQKQRILSPYEYTTLPTNYSSHQRFASIGEFTHKEAHILSLTNPNYKFLHLNHFSTEEFVNYLKSNDSMWKNIDDDLFYMRFNDSEIERKSNVYPNQKQMLIKILHYIFRKYSDSSLIYNSKSYYFCPLALQRIPYYETNELFNTEDFYLNNIDIDGDKRFYVNFNQIFETHFPFTKNLLSESIHYYKRLMNRDTNENLLHFDLEIPVNKKYH